MFTRGGALLAAPFDLERLELRGPAVPVLTGFAADPNFAQVHAAFADDGTVAFVPGRDLGLGRLAWIDRKGEGGWLDVDERAYQSFDVSPDGRRVAVQVADVRDYVWVWDSESGGRDLGGPGLVGWPVWSSDGHDLALTRRTTGSPPFEIVRHALESQTTERLASSEFEIRPESWVGGGRLSISESASNPRVGRLEIASGQAPQWVRSATRVAPCRDSALGTISPNTRSTGLRMSVVQMGAWRPRCGSRALVVRAEATTCEIVTTIMAVDSHCSGCSNAAR